MPAAAHVQISAGAANQFNVVNLVGVNSGQLKLRIIVFSGSALTVNQNLRTAAPAAKSATPPAGITVGATGQTKSSTTATASHIDPGDTIDHVHRGYRRPLREIACLVNDCGVFFSGSALSTDFSAGTDHPKQQHSAVCGMRAQYWPTG